MGKLSNDWLEYNLNKISRISNNVKFLENKAKIQKTIEQNNLAPDFNLSSFRPEKHITTPRLDKVPFINEVPKEISQVQYLKPKAPDSSSLKQIPAIKRRQRKASIEIKLEPLSHGSPETSINNDTKSRAQFSWNKPSKSGQIKTYVSTNLMIFHDGTLNVK